MKNVKYFSWHQRVSGTYRVGGDAFFPLIRKRLNGPFLSRADK